MAELVQYVIVRGDLGRKLMWPLGAIIAQACHACTSVIHLYYKDINVINYLSDLDRMHKVILEIEDESNLRRLSEKLTEAKVDHKLWIEQPENIATCLAVKPHLKKDVQQYFKGLKLLK
ncbi:peptidyl-tRNA hydrolase domain-containing protein 1 [Chamberlinius hualienensis]